MDIGVLWDFPHGRCSHTALVYSGEVLRIKEGGNTELIIDYSCAFGVNFLWSVILGSVISKVLSQSISYLKIDCVLIVRLDLFIDTKSVPRSIFLLFLIDAGIDLLGQLIAHLDTGVSAIRNLFGNIIVDLIAHIFHFHLIPIVFIELLLRVSGGLCPLEVRILIAIIPLANLINPGAALDIGSLAIGFICWPFE